MHEITLTRSLIDIVEEYARREGFSRVNVLKLSFGRLSWGGEKGIRNS